MQQGKINVQTENIFPVIKKFLYSDHEIFLRELVSNAVDASKKLKALASMGDFKDEIRDTTIEIKVDKTAKTITVSDKGVGMTVSEIEKYINQIAFSGAEEFVKKYKDKTEANLIGHFGLGFYSAFMVASKVEIDTKTYKKGPDTKAVKWECDGSPEYMISASSRKTRGTDIILHIAEDSEEFLEEERIKTILGKYCKFLPVEIKFQDSIINNTKPAWTIKPADLKEEDYKSFYKELYPFSEEPLFHIHLNVDYPFNLTGILYFPRLKNNNFEVQKNKIQLYSNQVFVTDSVEGIVPDFLTFLHGVLDSPDIPLNVSRSYLQSDSNVKKISTHITKKVADKLEDLFKNNRAEFEQKWDDIRLFIEYGMLSDEKFFERAVKFSLLKNTDGKYFSFEDYKEKIKAVQTDKNENLVYLYSSNATDQHSFIESANEKGYDVLLMDTPLSSHLAGRLEQHFEKSSFARVDADIIDNIIKKEDNVVSKLSEEEKEKLKPIIESQLSKDKFSIQFENLSETDQPMIITQPEFMRRMKDMSAIGGSQFGGTFPEMFNLIVNTNHPLISRTIQEKDEEVQKKLIRQVADLALLSQNMLKGEELTKFVKRSVELI